MATKRLGRLAIPALRSWLILVLLAVLALSLGLAPMARAVDFNVPCDTEELVNAINVANSNGEADTLNLEAGCTYNLTAIDNTTDGANGLPSIISQITINGNGVTIKRRSAAPAFRIFHVAVGGNLTLNELTVRNGLASGISPGSDGGGIFNRGTLELINSTVSGNSATDGGGINNNGGGTVLLTNSTVSGNSANDGGGIKSFTGQVTLTNSTVSDNSASNVGGGIFNSSPTMKLTNSTVSGNSASDGGGIFNVFGMVTLTNTTVSDNDGGGIFRGSLFTTVKLTNTIVANNHLVGDCAGLSSVVASSGHNLDSDGSCNLTEPSDLPGLDPLLGQLGDNGGPTETHALLAGSPAIEAGDEDACPTTDQRGQPRPADGDDDGAAICDIGAFERQPEDPTAITLASFTAEAGTDHVTLAWETSSEIDNEGFNLWRGGAANGPYTKLNPSLIPAEGDADTGASYAYADTDVAKGVTYYYKLEDVDIHGISTFHGPVSAMPSPIRRIYLPLVLK